MQRAPVAASPSRLLRWRSASALRSASLPFHGFSRRGEHSNPLLLLDYALLRHGLLGSLFLRWSSLFNLRHRSRLLHLGRLLRKLGRRERLSIDRDFSDPHRREILPVPAQLLVLLLALVVKDKNLRAPTFFHYLADNLYARAGLGHRALTWRNRQHVAKLYDAIGARRHLLHSNYVPGRHSVLLTASADDRVHTLASRKFFSPAHSCALRIQFTVLAVWCRGDRLSPGGRPRTVPHLQANSTILSCAVEIGQFKVVSTRFLRDS